MIEIKDRLYKNIQEYCKANEIADIPAFINKCVQAGFDLEKYGHLDKKNIPVPEQKIIENPQLTELDPKPKENKKTSTSEDYPIYDVL